MTMKRRIFDPSEHGVLPCQIKSEFTYTKGFLSFHKAFVGSALQARDLGMNLVSQLLRWRDFLTSRHGDEPGRLLSWRDFDI
jgi:hypothetical protein